MNENGVKRSRVYVHQHRVCAVLVFWRGAVVGGGAPAARRRVQFLLDRARDDGDVHRHRVVQAAVLGRVAGRGARLASRSVDHVRHERAFDVRQLVALHRDRHRRVGVHALAAQPRV